MPLQCCCNGCTHVFKLAASVLPAGATGAASSSQQVSTTPLLPHIRQPSSAYDTAQTECVRRSGLQSFPCKHSKVLKGCTVQPPSVVVISLVRRRCQWYGAWPILALAPHCEAGCPRLVADLAPCTAQSPPRQIMAIFRARIVCRMWKAC